MWFESGWTPLTWSDPVPAAADNHAIPQLLRFVIPLLARG